MKTNRKEEAGKEKNVNLIRGDIQVTQVTKE